MWLKKLKKLEVGAKIIQKLKSIDNDFSKKLHSCFLSLFSIGFFSKINFKKNFQNFFFYGK